MNESEPPDGRSATLEARAVSHTYSLPRERLLGHRSMLPVLHDVDFAVSAGEAVGLVGESGTGKTTLSRLLVGTQRPSGGSICFEGNDIWSGSAELRRRFRRSVQVVMQNPRSSLDPRMRVRQSLLQPLRGLRVQCDEGERIATVLEQVGLGRDVLEKYPHEFSGGQLQRIAIARGLMPGPKVLVADEPVSALDVSIRAHVLNLLKDLVAELGLGLVLIAHDLAVVAYTTSRVVVMASGRIVETGAPAKIFERPKAEATKALVDAVLTVEGGLAGATFG